MPINKITHADEVTVTHRWFVPHFPSRPDRLLEVAMVKEWREYMSYPDHHWCGWTTRLVADILAMIPGGVNIRTGRTAATFALWCMTPNGLGFLYPILRKIKEKGTTGHSLDQVAVIAWATENKLTNHMANTLGILVRDGTRQSIYKRRPYPTLEDHRAAEHTLCFLISEEGRDLLKRVCVAAGEPNRLPL